MWRTSKHLWITWSPSKFCEKLYKKRHFSTFFGRFWSSLEPQFWSKFTKNGNFSPWFKLRYSKKVWQAFVVDYLPGSLLQLLETFSNVIFLYFLSVFDSKFDSEYCPTTHEKKIFTWIMSILSRIREKPRPFNLLFALEKMQKSPKKLSKTTFSFFVGIIKDCLKT